jgi:pilus assembly protein CpaB
MRNRRALLFLSVAILLGAAAAFLAQRWLEKQKPVATGNGILETAEVVVARTGITVATALQPNQLTTVEWPKRYLPAGAFASPESLSGRVLRRAVTSGEPILEAVLLPAGSAAGLPSLIEQKRRALSVKVDQVIGVAGFVTPGTRVDVLATLRRVDSQKALPYTKVILQDVPVLAIDQQLEEAANGEPETVNVVTLEVTPVEAERLIYSAHEGRLQLALRNPVDREMEKTKSAGVRDVLGIRRPRASSNGKPRPRVEVYRGSNRSVQKF